MVGFLEIRDASEPAVIAVGPAVIGAGETGSISGVGSAQTVAAMPADIQERPHLAGTVAHDQHWIFAHIGREEVARLWDLALVAEKEPRARENLLEFLLV